MDYVSSRKYLPSLLLLKNIRDQMELRCGVDIGVFLMEQDLQPHRQGNKISACAGTAAEQLG